MFDYKVWPRPLFTVNIRVYTKYRVTTSESYSLKFLPLLVPCHKLTDKRKVGVFEHLMAKLRILWLICRNSENRMTFNDHTQFCKSQQVPNEHRQNRWKMGRRCGLYENWPHPPLQGKGKNQPPQWKTHFTIFPHQRLHFSRTIQTNDKFAIN